MSFAFESWGPPESAAPELMFESWGPPGTTLGGAIAERFDKPPEGELSLIGMAKALYEGLQAPGRAVSGQYNPPPETPGVLTEEDVFRQDQARRQEAKDAGGLAGATILGSVPRVLGQGGQNTLASGAARPGQAAPTPSPVPVVQAAERQAVELPRFLVDENRMIQGLAAGVQNIPGAGDKIAQAATRTTRQLGEATKRAEEGFGSGSPALAGSAAKDAITDWIGPGSEKIASRLYDAVDNLVSPTVTTELRATANAAQTILDRRAASKIPGRSAAVDSVMEAITSPGGMNYQGLKGLRSFIGEMTPEEIVAQGLKASEVKQLYGAMTVDLRQAVQRGGGSKALAAFERANSAYEQISERRKALAKIIGVKGDAAPEAVYARLLAMAGSKSSANASSLALARKTMGADAWNEVASAVVSKLGRDPQGEFSIQRFLTAYGNLSPQGRNTLFQSTGKDNLARALEDINFLSSSINEKLQRFSNPSGTGRSVASTGTVLGLLTDPLKTISTLVGGNRLAAMLSQPASARAVADWMRAYQAAINPPTADSARKISVASERFAEALSRAGFTGLVGAGGNN